MTSQPASDAELERRRAELAAAFRAGQLPPRQPSANHVTDTDVAISRAGDEPQLVVLFSHRDFPAVRFGHRFPPDDSSLQQIWLKEEIETGALDRMMADPPAPDSAGIVWTNWDDES